MLLAVLSVLCVGGSATCGWALWVSIVYGCFDVNVFVGRGVYAGVFVSVVMVADRVWRRRSVSLWNAVGLS